MPRSAEARVNPKLLIWARKSAGYNVETAASKLRMPSERVQAWEEGSQRPSISQLHRVGNLYKRPIAVFFLPEPPEGFSVIQDFRRLAGRTPAVQTPEFRLEIRGAYTRREVALELLEETEGAVPGFSVGADTPGDPEAVGAQVRQALSITYEQQRRWRDEYQALGAWRRAIEDAGVLVFQSTGVEVVEMRGFSINERPLPVIVMNGKDTPNGRVFSLLHEFAHLMLNEGGMCDMVEGARRAKGVEEKEVLCNRIAGAALVPREQLLAEPTVAEGSATVEWEERELLTLARRYGVSREVVLRRLLICGRTTNGFYRRMRQQFEEQYLTIRSRGRTTGGPSPHTMAISRAGSRFARLVVTGYRQERITAGDVSDFLGVRLKHLPKIEADLFGGPFRQ